MQIIKQLRRKNGINQSDLAGAIGVSLRTIQLYEKPDANIPIKNLTKIADYFQTSIAALYLQEVNEEEGTYAKRHVVNAEGNTGYVLSNGKYLISAPVLLTDFHEEFLHNFKLENPSMCNFMIDYLDDTGYMAFELVGNAMNDGSLTVFQMAHWS